MMRKTNLLPNVQVSRKVSNVITVAALIILALLCLIPFLWMLVMSLKTEANMWIIPPSLHPSTLTIENYIIIWNTETPSIRIAFLNSSFVTLTSTFGGLITASMAAYAFAKLGFKGRNKLFSLVLSTMMIPGQVTMIPCYIIMKKLGWINTFLPLIIPAIFVDAYGVFMLRQYFMTIPDSIMESAKIDGANQPYIFIKLIIPMSTPALLSLLLIRFMSSWNSFMTPMIYINKIDKITLPLYIRHFENAYNAQWHLMMAASCVVIIPVLLLYLFTQRHLTDGILVGSVKG